jgi:alkylation response protein AidB-like acyl-CoA dehydrogenase
MERTMGTSSGLCFALTDEQELLRGTVRDFVERECPKHVAREIEAASEWPHDLWDRMAAAGFHGIGVPAEYGGQGGSTLDQLIVAEELARSLAGLTWAWAATSFSGAKSVGLYGTEQQKQDILPRLARGELVFSISLTEPGGGTDVLRAMRTVARPVDGGFVVNGRKVWSTGAHAADKLLLVARTSESAKPSEGLTLFVCEARAPGVTATPIPKIGMRAIASCEVVYENVFVPEDAVLGEVGRGWDQLVRTLNNERLMVAAVCLGITAGVLEDAVRYANERTAFGKPIGSFQAIQHGIADMKMKYDAARLLTHRAAWLQDTGRPSGVESSAAKLMASLAAVESADFGIQVLGGYGYSMEYDMQRYWRDARLYPLGPVSNEMVRNYIGESLGLPRSF